MISVRDFKRSIYDFSENPRLAQQLYVAGTIGGAILLDEKVGEIRDALRENRQKRNGNVPALLREAEMALNHYLRKA